MRNTLPILSLLFFLPGCTSLRLQTSTLDQAGSLMDLHYQQTLNNLAQFLYNPYAIPSIVSLKDGSAQIADLGSAGVMAGFARSTVTTPNILGSRTVVEQWGMTPVTDDTELKLLRMAYRRAIGFNDSLGDNENDLANELAHQLKKQTPDVDDFRGDVDKMYDQDKNRYKFRRGNVFELFFPLNSYDEFIMRTLSEVDPEIIYKEESPENIDVWGYYNSVDTNGKLFFNKNFIYNNPNYKLKSRYGFMIDYVTPDAAEIRRQVREVQQELLEIHSGWYGYGRKKDVPKDACYVGHYRDCYVWVRPGGLQELSRLTLTTLNFSTIVKETSVFTVPGPRYTPSSGFPSL